jgi:ketosteroid isomerase-like protein
MAEMFVSNLERDGESRSFAAHGGAMLCSAGAVTMMRGVFEPGWRWSQDVRPLAGSDSCQTRHMGYVISGRMHIVADDGSELDIGPGDVFDLPPGHDAEVLGDEPAVLLDVSPEATGYARGGAAIVGEPDPHVLLVRRGYQAFNSADLATLSELIATDAMTHVPGHGALSGDYKGRDAILGYYGQLAEMTDGTFRADLIDAHGDGHGHVAALHQITATRGGVTRVTRGTLVFTFVGDKVTDMLELRADIAGDDAFLS